MGSVLGDCFIVTENISMIFNWNTKHMQLVMQRFNQFNCNSHHNKFAPKCRSFDSVLMLAVPDDRCPVNKK